MRPRNTWAVAGGRMSSGRWSGYFLVIGLLKLSCLIAIGPQWTPDTGGYVAFAEQILHSKDWATHVEFSEDPEKYWGNDTTFRMIGYPLVIAGMMRISAEYWDWLIAILQIVVATSATFLLFDTLVKISGSRLLSLALATVQTINVNFALDQAILTDSLYLSLLLTITCALVRAALAGRLSPFRLLTIGLGFMACFLLREASIALCCLWASLILVTLMRTGRTARTAVALTIGAYLPMLTLHEGYKAWNKYRSGEPFVTTFPQHGLLQPLVGSKRDRPDLVVGTPLLDRLIVEALSQRKPGFYPEVGTVNVRLRREFGYPPLRISDEVRQSFVATWRTQPMAMAQLSLARVTPESLRVISPLTTRLFLQFHEMDLDKARRSEPVLSRRQALLAQSNWSWSLLYSLQRLFTLASVAILASSIIAIIVLALSGDARRIQLSVEILALAVIPPCFLAIHSLIYVEPRYLCPVVPIVLIIFAWSVKSATELYRSVRGSRLKQTTG